MCDDGADNFGRTLQLGRMPSVRRKRRKQGNVGGGNQSSVEGVLPSLDAALHRGSHLAGPLNPAGITIEILAHGIRTCGSTRTNRCRTANSSSLRNNLLGRFWGVWDGAVRRIAPIISSASLGIDHRALLVSCHHNDNSQPYRNIGRYAMRARVGTSVRTCTSLLQGRIRPILLVAGGRPMWAVRSTAN